VDSKEKTDSASSPPDPSARTRRVDGARQPVSEVVEFKQGDRSVTGWALNMSRGGLRAALEEKVEVGEEFEIAVGDAEPRSGRIVWVRNQKDGSIVGVAFNDSDGSVPPPPSPDSMPGHDESE
jgi:hypothetical protein